MEILESMVGRYLGVHDGARAGRKRDQTDLRKQLFQFWASLLLSINCRIFDKFARSISRELANDLV